MHSLQRRCPGVEVPFLDVHLEKHSRNPDLLIWYWNILKHIDIYLELFHIPSVRNWCTWVRHSTGQRSTEANEAWYRRRSKWWNLEHVHSQLLPHCRAHAVVGFQHPQACHARAANCPSGLAREMKAIMFLISTCIHQPISQSKLWISNQLWRLWHVLPSESLSWKTHFDNAHLDKPSCWGKSRCCLASLGEMTFNSSIYSVTVRIFISTIMYSRFYRSHSNCVVSSIYSQSLKHLAMELTQLFPRKRVISCPGGLNETNSAF